MSKVIRAKNVPLVMSERLVGRINLDYRTGELTGQVDPELAEIIVYGIGENLLQLGFIGRPVDDQKQALVAQERFTRYLKNVEDDEFTNLGKARKIVRYISELNEIKKVMRVDAIKKNLEGDIASALNNPLYIEAQAKIDELEEELNRLVKG